MPRYAREFVSDADLQDIYAYLASVKAGPAAKDIPLLRE
jgi:mono/diheme cytochrome c family protein